MMWTSEFWRQSFERAVKTTAQVLLTYFVVGQTDLATFNWSTAALAGAVGFIASVLTSLASSPFGPEDSPSVVE